MHKQVSGWTVNFGPNCPDHKFTPEYPPPPENWNLGRSWHFVTFQFRNTPPPRKLKLRQILACVTSYHMWRLYPTRITTRCLCWSPKSPKCFFVVVFKWQNNRKCHHSENELINTLLIHGKSIHKFFHEKNPTKGTQKLIITTTGRTELFV